MTANGSASGGAMAALSISAATAPARLRPARDSVAATSRAGRAIAPYAQAAAAMASHGDTVISGARTHIDASARPTAAPITTDSAAVAIRRTVTATPATVKTTFAIRRIDASGAAGA